VEWFRKEKQSLGCVTIQITLVMELLIAVKKTDKKMAIQTANQLEPNDKLKLLLF
jgi:hypothetical protein